MSLGLRKEKAGLFDKDETPIAFTVQYDKPRLAAYVHSAALTVGAQAGEVHLRLSDKIESSIGKSRAPAAQSQRVAIPGRYSLAMREAKLLVADNERERERRTDI